MFARLERFANSETVENIVLLRLFRDHKFFIGPGCLVYQGVSDRPLVTKLDRSAEVASRGCFSNSRSVSHISVIAPSTIVGRNGVPAAVVELGPLHEPCCQAPGRWPPPSASTTEQERSMRRTS